MLVDARIRPAGIAFVNVGQPVEVKLAACEYTVYGGLQCVVHGISPDALGDPEMTNTPGDPCCLALVLAEGSRLHKADEVL